MGWPGSRNEFSSKNMGGCLLSKDAGAYKEAVLQGAACGAWFQRVKITSEWGEGAGSFCPPREACGPWARATVKRQGFNSNPALSPALFGFSSATGLGNYTHSPHIESSPRPLTDLGQNSEMPKTKDFFFFSLKGMSWTFTLPCPGSGMQALCNCHQLLFGGPQPGGQAYLLQAPLSSLIRAHWIFTQERHRFSQARGAVQGNGPKLHTST